MSTYLDTARRVKGLGFAEVADAVRQARSAMVLFDLSRGQSATREERTSLARSLTTSIGSIASAYKLDPGLFAEAIRHGHVIFRESLRG